MKFVIVWVISELTLIYCAPLISTVHRIEMVRRSFIETNGSNHLVEGGKTTQLYPADKRRVRTVSVQQYLLQT